MHVVLDERENIVHALVLVVMGVDVDDQDVVELALLRLLPGVGQKPGGVELFDGDAPAAIGNEFHGVSPCCFCPAGAGASLRVA